MFIVGYPPFPLGEGSHRLYGDTKRSRYTGESTTDADLAAAFGSSTDLRTLCLTEQRLFSCRLSICPTSNTSNIRGYRTVTLAHLSSRCRILSTNILRTGLANAIGKSLEELATRADVSYNDKARVRKIEAIGTMDAKVAGGSVIVPDFGFITIHNHKNLLVLEVGFAQDTPSLEARAKKWFQTGVNTVIDVNIDYVRPAQRPKSEVDRPVTYTVRRIVPLTSGKVSSIVVYDKIPFLEEPDGFLSLKLSDFCRRGDKADEYHAIQVSHEKLADISEKANCHQRGHDKEQEVLESEYVELPAS